jgi:hypothetical protein
VVHVPEEGVLFTGDILFKDAHPVIWQGPVSNWIRFPSKWWYRAMDPSPTCRACARRWSTWSG